MDNLTLTAQIDTEYQGQRLDAVLPKLFPAYSRAKLQQCLQEGQITVAGQTHVPGKTKVQGGEEVTLIAPSVKELHWQPQDLPLDIIYEDDVLLIINKPAGLVTHPAPGNPDNTLINAVLHHCPANQSLPRGGIVHRLDKDTTGLLLVAKTEASLRYFVELLKTREISREYRALVRGEMISGGTVDAPIGRHPKDRLRQAVITHGKPATTHYRILQRFRGFTLLQLHLESGRTHQIRVHMSHLGFPVVGDQLYAGRLHCPVHTALEVKQALQQFKRQALHAYCLSFIHPVSLEKHSFSTPLPLDFRHLLTLLEQYHAVDFS